MQTQGENLKALQAKFDDRGEVAGSWLLEISSPKIKISKGQSLLHTDGTIMRWRAELSKCEPE